MKIIVARPAKPRRSVQIPGLINRRPQEKRISFWITFKELLIKSSYSFEPKHTARTIALLDRIKDKYPLEDIVSHKFTLVQTTEAVKAVKDLKTIKAVLVPSG